MEFLIIFVFILTFVAAIRLMVITKKIEGQIRKINLVFPEVQVYRNNLL